MVEVAGRQKGAPRRELRHVGIERISDARQPGVTNERIEDIREDAVTLLKALVKEISPSTKDAVASLPPFDVFMTLVDFPAMEAKDVAKALIFQAKQYVPMPLSEVALDWMKIADYQDEKGFAHQKILLISVPQEQIKKYQRMFTAAGLRLQALEIESLSIARIFANDPTSTTIVDIGSPVHEHHLHGKRRA